MAGPTRVSLDELLVRHGAITEEQLQRAKQEQQTIGGDLGRTLVHLGFITEELLMRAWAHQMGIRGVAPDKMALGEDLLQAISVQLCETFGIIAVGRDPRTNALLIATNDPANAEQLSAIEKSVGEKVLPAAATTSSIERAIRRHYYGESPKVQPDAGATDADALLRGGEAASQPQVAALLTRIERLEQQTSARDKQVLQVLRVIGDVLVEKGLVSREDYLRRARGE
jgi:type IV pilus assembly protein PilB